MIEREDPGESPYTHIANDLLNDASLSAEALGVLVYLLSKPANWRVMPAELGKRFSCGRDRIYRILNELAAAGYARREQSRVDGSFGDVKYIISSRKRPLTENTDTADLPLPQTPRPENTTLQKKDSTKDRIQQMGELSLGAAAPPDLEKQFFDRAVQIITSSPKDARSTAASLRKACGMDIAKARSVLELSSGKSDPAHWIRGHIAWLKKKSAEPADATVLMSNADDSRVLL